MGLIHIILYEMLGELPFLIFMGVLYWIAIDLLLPNPRKHGRFFGWLAMELIEHILMPVIGFFTVMIFPVLFYPVMAGLTFLVFGVLVGKAKTVKDWLKVLMIFITFNVILGTSFMIMLLQWTTGMPGWIVMVVLTVLAGVPYLVYKLKDKR